jgi:SAM-dependent methyltransferase
MSFKRNEGGFMVCCQGESHKARERRVREGWFEKYAPADKVGIDIGCYQDPLHPTFRRWDFFYKDTDATYLEGIEPESFYTVYSSHLLEHLKYPRVAIKRWYEVLKPTGHLIIMVPHRDLYEQRKVLPSYWNINHRYFWLPDIEEPPSVKSLQKEVLAAVPKADIVSLRVLDEGYEPNTGPENHPVGEFSIEIIVRKDRE